MFKWVLSRTRFSKDQHHGPMGVAVQRGLVTVGQYTYGAEQMFPHFWNSETKLTIGSYCSIADNVHVFLGGNHRMDWISTFPFGREVMQAMGAEATSVTNGDIVIGSDVWIGSHVSIMSGVTVGSGAVLAAYAHVVRDVEPYSVVGGNPARHLRHRFTPDVVGRLVNIAWWEWPSTVVFDNRALLSELPSAESLTEMERVSMQLHQGRPTN